MGTVREPTFLVPENAVYVWTESRTGKKISVFKNIRRRENATSSQGFSLKKNGWEGKAEDEVGENGVCIFLFTRSHLLGPSQ